MKNSTFNPKDIENFLMKIGKNFAAICWHNDMVAKSFHQNPSNEVSYLDASNWFQKYFPSNTNQYLFRLMECECAQSVKL